jgi:hypothetical protein
MLIRSIKTLSIILKHFGEFFYGMGAVVLFFSCLRHGDSWADHLRIWKPRLKFTEVISSDGVVIGKYFQKTDLS